MTLFSQLVDMNSTVNVQITTEVNNSVCHKAIVCLPIRLLSALMAIQKGQRMQSQLNKDEKSGKMARN